MGLSDGETQSSLKQNPALVLFGKCAPAVLNRTPNRSTNLILYQTASRDLNRTCINLQLVLVQCVLSSSVQPSTRRFWSTLCFHLLTSFMEMLISFYSINLAPAHTAKTTSKWFAGHDVTVLDRPANIPGIWNIVICDIFHMESMGYFGINGIFSREIWESRSNNPDELKAQ